MSTVTLTDEQREILRTRAIIVTEERTGRVDALDPIAHAATSGTWAGMGRQNIGGKFFRWTTLHGSSAEDLAEQLAARGLELWQGGCDWERVGLPPIPYGGLR